MGGTLIGNSSLVLYMIYYPDHLKYAQLDDDEIGEASISERSHQHLQSKYTHIRSDDWRLSITLFWVVIIHMYASSPHYRPELSL